MQTAKAKVTRCKRVNSYIICWYDFDGGSLCAYRTSSKKIVQTHDFWDRCHAAMRSAHGQVLSAATRCESFALVETLHNRTVATKKCRNNRSPKYWSPGRADVDMIVASVAVIEHYNSCEFVDQCKKVEKEACHA